MIKYVPEAGSSNRGRSTRCKRHGTPNKPCYLSTPVARRTRIDTAINVECIANKLRDQKRIAKSGHRINDRLRE